jgi:uncharacterized membrane protein YkvA (DUF1232 family)
MADHSEQKEFDDAVDEAFAQGDELIDELIEEGLPSRDLPSKGLLSFYDRLRGKIESYLSQRSGAGDKVADVLLLVPDVFVFLLRLLLDPEVPKAKRALIGSALAYFVLPVDLLPEAFMGPAGFVDDLVLALAVLSQSFGSDLEPWARKYWSGSQNLRKVLRDVLQSAHGLLGTDLHGRLRKALARRGVALDEASEVLTLDSEDGENGDSEDADRGYDDPYAN